MSPRHRLFVALLCLAPALGCVSFCDPDSAPPVLIRCDAEDTESEVDAIGVEGYQAFGGQGVEMIMFDVRYEGADPPTCARVDYTLRDVSAAGAPSVGGASELVETQDVRPGVRQTTSPIWETWPTGASVIAIEVSSHGSTSVEYVCRSGTLDCERLDGGFTLDAGADAGVGDAGP